MREKVHLSGVLFASKLCGLALLLFDFVAAKIFLSLSKDDMLAQNWVILA